MTTTQSQKHDQTVKEISQSARICWTCGGAPNPTNFGGLCDPCTIAKQERLTRSAQVLKAHGQSASEFGRALTFLGYDRG